MTNRKHKGIPIEDYKYVCIRCGECHVKPEGDNDYCCNEDQKHFIVKDCQVDIAMEFRRLAGFEIFEASRETDSISLHTVQQINRKYGNRKHTPLHLQGYSVKFTEAFWEVV